MIKKILLFILIALTTNLSGTTKVHAAEYEEVTYEDLVNRLNKKKVSIENSSGHHPMDDILIHAGAGLVTSVTSIKINDQNFTRQQNGFQLSMGIDLFSDQWAAEGTILNFGTENSGSETRSLHEVQMKVIYRNKMNAQMGVRVGGGFSTRTLKISDPVAGLYINDTTPAWAGSLGLDSYLTKSFSIGADLSLKSAMIATTTDKSSVDFTIRLNSYF
jgi:hypothetical protein